MTIRLRAHHLLCMLTYAGDGYSDAFTANFNAIVERIGAREDVLIVAGPDDLCAPLLDDPEPHCLNESVRARDALAARDLGKLLGRETFVRGRVTLGEPELERLRNAFGRGDVREACLGCEWHRLCTAMARRGFHGAKLATSS